MTTDKELRDRVFGSQCKRCNGFPTDRQVFKGTEALFHKCTCGNYAPRDSAQYRLMIESEE